MSQEPFDYFYSRLLAQVYVTETNNGKFKVVIDDPFAARSRPHAAKVFTRGEDPSAWIGEQLGRVMPKLIADLHAQHNDDWKQQPEPAPPTAPHPPSRGSWEDSWYGYDDEDYWRYWA